MEWTYYWEHLGIKRAAIQSYRLRAAEREVGLALRCSQRNLRLENPPHTFETRDCMANYLLALKDRQEVAKDTTAFWFNTLGSGYTFRAGQNADFILIDPPKTDGEGNARTFSFSTSPNNRASLMVAMRMRKRAFKESLQTVPLGTRLKVTSPIGSFTLHKDSPRPAVFLAGGIGITPICSVIGWATEEKLSHRLYLFYSNRTPKEAAFLNRLESWVRCETRRWCCSDLPISSRAASLRWERRTSCSRQVGDEAALIETVLTVAPPKTSVCHCLAAVASTVASIRSNCARER
jgi:flavin-dependent oxidoreductase